MIDTRWYFRLGFYKRSLDTSLFFLVEPTKQPYTFFIDILLNTPQKNKVSKNIILIVHHHTLQIQIFLFEGWKKRISRSEKRTGKYHMPQDIWQATLYVNPSWIFLSRNSKRDSWNTNRHEIKEKNN